MLNKNFKVHTLVKMAPRVLFASRSFNVFDISRMNSVFKLLTGNLLSDTVAIPVLSLISTRTELFEEFLDEIDEASFKDFNLKVEKRFKSFDIFSLK